METDAAGPLAGEGDTGRSGLFRGPIQARTYERLAFAALLAVAVIILTGAAVRLTGSGLGCSDWPTCEEGQFVAEAEFHALVEFGNRVFTGVVSLAVAGAVLGAHRRTPRRRDLILLAWGLVAGIIGQILLGRITVLTHLSPTAVMSHFLLSMVMVANAVVLHHRASRVLHHRASRALGTGRQRAPVASRDVVLAGRGLVVAAAVVLLSGTVVTGTGPHGGDPDVERLPFFLPDVARIHGAAVWLFLAGTLATLWVAHRERAPESVLSSGRTLVAVIVAQGIVGYTQYVLEVPAALVAVHIVGAVSVWVATLRFVLRCNAPANGEVAGDETVDRLVDPSWARIEGAHR